MQTAWDNVAGLLAEMRPLLVEALVPERQVQMPIGKQPDEIKTDQYVKAFDWLHELKLSQAWLNLLKVKALLPQERWDRYKAHDIRGLREQKMLEVAQIEIRKAWKTNRPAFFGRTYTPKESEPGAAVA